MPLKMGNNVDTKRVPSVRSLKTSAPCRDKRKVSRIQQKTDVAKRKDHERSHEIWSFAAITFAFANYILRQAPPELRSKVEDFAQASPGLLTMIQNGPQMNIPPKVCPIQNSPAQSGTGILCPSTKDPDWLVAIQRHQVEKR